MSRLSPVRAAAVAAMLAASQGTAMAGNFGSDLNLTLTPAAGGMGGAGYVRPQDPVAAVFGNPATQAQLEGNTSFTFGGSLLDVFAHASHDGSITGAPFSGDSAAKYYLLPNIAVMQRINDRLVAGGGLQVISGLGADFREETPLAPQVELVIFGVNGALAYQATPRLALGASVTVAFGLLEVGLLRNTGLRHAFGVRAAAGLTYDVGPVMAGLAYNSPLELNFDNVTETAPGAFSGVRIQQPQEVIFGLASTPALLPNWVLETDVIFKNWSSAETYRDLWQNQTIAAVGAQRSLGPWKLRLGYSYSTDLQKKNVGSSIGNLKSLAVGGATVPISRPLVQFVQATLTQPYWQQQVSAGAGYSLTRNIQVDVHAGYAFDGERTIGGTEVDVEELQAGFGVTWRF